VSTGQVVIRQALNIYKICVARGRDFIKMKTSQILAGKKLQIFCVLLALPLVAAGLFQTVGIVNLTIDLFQSGTDDFSLRAWLTTIITGIFAFGVAALLAAPVKFYAKHFIFVILGRVFGVLVIAVGLIVYIPLGFFILSFPEGIGANYVGFSLWAIATLWLAAGSMMFYKAGKAKEMRT
jgi:hypothetical protein